MMVIIFTKNACKYAHCAYNNKHELRDSSSQARRPGRLKKESIMTNIYLEDALNWVSGGDLYLAQIDSEEAKDLALEIIKKYKKLWADAFKNAGFDVLFCDGFAPSNPSSDYIDVMELWELEIGHLEYPGSSEEMAILLEMIENEEI